MPEPTDAERWTFIYALVDPRDRTIRYVGKSNTPYHRVQEHALASNTATNKQKQRWMQELSEAQLIPRVLILESVPLAGWETAEKRWIAHAKREGWPIVNIQPGGNGSAVRTAEAAERIRAFQCGRIHSAEHNAKISASQKGKKLSEETKQKLRLANLGKKITPEQRAHMSAAKRTGPLWNRGKKGLQVAWNKGLKTPDDVRAKLSAAHKGKPGNRLGIRMSQATKAKISATKKAKRRAQLKTDMPLFLGIVV